MHGTISLPRRNPNIMPNVFLWVKGLQELPGTMNVQVRPPRDYKYTTDGDTNISHRRIIGMGGVGEVHMVPITFHDTNGRWQRRTDV